MDRDDGADSPANLIARRLRSLSIALAVVVILIGSTALVGWVTRIAALKSIIPGLVTMKVNTAANLIFMAITLVGLTRQSRLGQKICVIFISIATLLALATLCEYATGRNLHIDDWLIHDTDSPRYPGRGAPATQFGILGLSLGYALLLNRRWSATGQIVLFLVLLAPLVTLGGYLYGAPGMYENVQYPVIALNTSTALALLCLGGLLARPNSGLMRIVASDSLAGSLGRKLLPAAVGLPMIIGLLVLAGEKAGLYRSAFGSSVIVCSCALFFGASVCWSIVLLSRSEAVREKVERERERLLRSEQDARLQAEQANRMKDEFLSVLSHELRTPLNAILGWSEILRVKAVDEELIQGLEVIERNTRVQVKIVEDLLDMSRIINGKLHLELQPVDLARVIDAAMQSMQPAAAARGVVLKKAIEPDAGQLTGDPNRLQQVVWNLLSNAIKFTPRAGAVTVSLARAHSSIVISVTDTGSGISGDFLPYVFERFRQADGSTTRRFGGLGLGLAIVKHLSELHGGKVNAHSPGAGLGSTFTVSLPITPIAAEPAVLNSSTGVLLNASPLAPMLSGLRVLVVDDEADSRAMVKHLLESRSAIATLAGSVEEAIDLFSSTDAGRSFDVLVSDIGMPQRDGLDLIRTLRKLPHNQGGLTPAVALTAYARSDERTRALLAGFDMHLAKPVDPGELCAIVAKLASRTAGN